MPKTAILSLSLADRLDAIAQISSFVKLKLAKCAQPGDRAGFLFGASRRDPLDIHC
jgi:hypothetical protein